MAAVPSAVSCEQVVAYLVGNNYLLTALELFMEACESGREAEVEQLHRLFRDPARFPPEEVARFNPQDALSMQSVARQREQQLSMLDYELRVAQEDLRELHRRSQQSAEHEAPPLQHAQQDPAAATLSLPPADGKGSGDWSPAPARWREHTLRGTSGAAWGAPNVEGGPGNGGPEEPVGAGAGAAPCQQQAALTSAERRELLAAMRVFLEGQGLKLTAMTLAEECGGATPRARAQAQAPPSFSLAQCYRAQQAQQALSQRLEDAQHALNAQAAEMAVLRHQLAEAQLHLERERSARLTAEADLQFVQGKFRYALAQQGAGSGAPVAAPGQEAQAQLGAVQDPAVASGPAKESALPLEAGVLPQVGGSASAPSASATCGPPLPSDSTQGSLQAPAAPGGLVRPQSASGAGATFGLPGAPPGDLLASSRANPRGSEAGNPCWALPAAVAELGASVFASQRQPNEEAEGGPDSEYCVLGVEGALDEVAACLPNIIPNVLINKREELIPMLLALCQEHPSPGTRRRTAALLFNLIKKPNAAQRSLIVAACMQLAKRIGPARAALELLPHVLSQARHECLERRLLVAEALGSLAALLPPGESGALLREGVEGLAGDLHPKVRAVATAALGSLAAALPDLDAYPQLQALLLRLGGDECQEVINALLQQAVPALLRRLGPSHLLTTQLLPQVLSELHGLLQKCPFLAGTNESSLVNGTAVLRAVPDSAQRQAGVLLQLYMVVLPAVRSCALHDSPDWAVAWADRQMDSSAELEVQRAQQAQHGHIQAQQHQAPALTEPAEAVMAAAETAEAAGPTAAAEPGLSGAVCGISPTPSGVNPANPFVSPRARPALAVDGAAFGAGALSAEPPASSGAEPEANGGNSSSILFQGFTGLGIAQQHQQQQQLLGQHHLPPPPQQQQQQQPDPSESPTPPSGHRRLGSSDSGTAGWLPGDASPRCQDGEPERLLTFVEGGCGGLLSIASLPPSSQPGSMGTPCSMLPRANSGDAPEGRSVADPDPKVPSSAWSGPGITPEQLEAANAFGQLRRVPFAAASASPFGRTGQDAGGGFEPSSVWEPSPSGGLPSQAATSGPTTTRISSVHTSQEPCLSGSQGGQASSGSSEGGAMPAVVRAQQRSLLWEEAAFAAWAPSERHAQWHAVEYMAAEAIPLLIRSAQMVAPARDTLHLRHKLASAFKATSAALGAGFARDVVEPAMLAACGAPDWRPPAARSSLHVAAIARWLAPASTEAERAGRCTVLPLLLAGVLAGSPGAADAAACVRRLACNGGTGAVWAVTHPQAFVEAVRFAADSLDKQSVLMEVMWEAATSKSPGARLAAALLAGALVPALFARQVSRQLLPAILTLAADADASVRSAGMAAAAEVFRAFPSDQQLQESLLGELDGVLSRGGYAAELALLRALGPLASSASEAQALWLLQRVQLMLATMHQRAACGRTPGQLAETAAALFDTLRLMEAHEFTCQEATLHFAAALQALQREGDLLEPPQRDALAAMLADHAVSHEGLVQRPGSGGGAPAGLDSFLPGVYSAALPAGTTLSNMARHVGTGARSALLAQAASAGANLGMAQVPAGQQQASGAAAGPSHWGIFRGWQYGAA